MNKKEAFQLIHDFLDTLRKIRVEAGFTRVDFAKLIGMNDSVVSGWERMYTLPRPTSIKRMWPAIGGDVERITGFTCKQVCDASYLIATRFRGSIKQLTITDEERKKACKEVGDRLYQIRRDKELSRRTIEVGLGIGKSTYRSWELGKYAPTYENMCALCKMFEIEASDPIWALWRRSSSNSVAHLSEDDKQELQISEPVVAGTLLTAASTAVPDIPVVKATLTAVHVSLARVLNRMNDDGIVADTPLIIQSYVSRYSAYVVAEAFNKKNGRDYLELPWVLPKSTLTPHPTYVWVQDGVLQHATDMFEFDWSGYLKRNNLSVRVVMSAEEEDSDFFQGG